MDKKEELKIILSALIDNGKIELGTKASRLLLKILGEIEEKYEQENKA